MSATSDIEWTDATWNPVKGCTKVSPGCARCYAETFAERFRGVPGHPFEQGFDLKLWPERLGLPLRWKKPKRIFVNSMSDLFHESVPDEFIDAVFATMALAHWHTFQVLTKRPERMRAYLADLDDGVRREDTIGEAIDYALGEGSEEVFPEDRDFDVYEKRRPSWVGVVYPGGMKSRGEIPWPLPNVWLGTSVENQHWADIRVPELLATPAALRFLSCEPLLGPLVLTNMHCFKAPDGLDGESWEQEPVRPGHMRGLHWVIAGGESGPGARAMDVAWPRSLRDQCRDAGVPFFLKQLGARPFGSRIDRPGNLPLPERAHGRGLHLVQAPGGGDLVMGDWPLKSRKGGDMAEWPEDLRVREMPV